MAKRNLPTYKFGPGEKNLILKYLSSLIVYRVKSVMKNNHSNTKQVTRPEKEGKIPFSLQKNEDRKKKPSHGKFK